MSIKKTIGRGFVTFYVGDDEKKLRDAAKREGVPLSKLIMNALKSARGDIWLAKK